MSEDCRSKMSEQANVIHALRSQISASTAEVATLNADLKKARELQAPALRMVGAFDLMTGEGGLSIGMSPGRECRIFDEAIAARNRLNASLTPASGTAGKPAGEGFDADGCRHVDGICARVGFPGHVKPEDF